MCVSRSFAERAWQLVLSTPPTFTSKNITDDLRSLFHLPTSGVPAGCKHGGDRDRRIDLLGSGVAVLQPIQCLNAGTLRVSLHPAAVIDFEIVRIRSLRVCENSKREAKKNASEWRLHIGKSWQIGMESQAGTAATLVFGHAGSHSVNTVAADEPTVLISNHGSELDTHNAMGAPNDQFRIGRRKVCWHAHFAEHVQVRTKHA
jgi:hypothetical protein